ncbi:hypothetical protein CEK71_12395 [Methylovulum psychrotolerans]|jgi:hypothetical protein|uniref:Uncharacterized protein n=1 Tax=Methylovulum psychrotolerans TaxID=1704499 RepID=A0A1Z4BZW6_9GAMM|nr:hypothetical protein CEK71_12395 [Methylovulum psychrotolerans]
MPFTDILYSQCYHAVRKNLAHLKVNANFISEFNGVRLSKRQKISPRLHFFIYGSGIKSRKGLPAMAYI